ncbi:hypothetical protein ONZ51_g5575 [Trametes cubensis]|uniref:Uncharacterized protein n=1 Tax=Trametes cubensis TaxID=1111947 RepID=A0AAD7X996_9APHY|nr:hypothetical protein ONZ51_g5575 [Trametes cubensis]
MEAVDSLHPADLHMTWLPILYVHYPSLWTLQHHAKMEDLTDVIENVVPERQRVESGAALSAVPPSLVRTVNFEPEYNYRGQPAQLRFQQSYGSGGGTQQAGCCTKCCGKSFDEDDFATARNGADGNTQNGDAVASQPPPQKPMAEKPADS